MSKLSSLVLGVVSGAAMFGAIQYASGNDLRGTIMDSDRSVAPEQIASNTINRAAKADRASLNAAQGDQQSQTVSFRVHGVSDTSILVRLAGTASPTKNEIANSRAVTTAKPQRAAVACEPPVSVLTDVAKLLQPGRCVT